MRRRMLAETDVNQISAADQGREKDQAGVEKNPDPESAQKYLSDFFGPQAIIEISQDDGQGGLKFSAETIIALTEEERNNEQAGLSVSLRGRLSDKEKNIWAVDQATADYNGRQFALGDLMPAGVSLTFSPDANNYKLKERIVNVNGLSTVDSLCGLLHEAGHAINNTPEDRFLFYGWDKEFKGEAIEWGDPGTLGERIKAISDSERRAWASAYFAAKKAGWPIKKPMLQMMERSLSTYDGVIAFSRFRDFEGKDFATKKSKKLFATREKQMESRLFIELMKKLENLKAEIGVDVDLNLIEGELIEYEKDKRRYSVKLSDKTGRFFSVSERCINEDGSIGSTYLTTDHSYLIISKRITNIEKAPDGTDQIKTDVLMDEKMELLEEDSLDRNKIDDIGYEASMAIARLDINLLAVAAFRKAHPEAPEPPNFDSETGRPLSLAQKIKFMKGAQKPL